MKFNLYLFILITLLLVNQLYLIDLTPEVKSTLLADHETMQKFRPQYKELSCRLLSISKIKYLYEVEKLDDYYYKIIPSQRENFLDHIKSKMYNRCMLEYKDDKFIFESELFYSYPREGNDNDYAHYVNISLDEAVEEFNDKYNEGKAYESVYFTKPKKEKGRKTKKERKTIAKSEEEENRNTENTKTDKKEEIDDLDKVIEKNRYIEGDL